MGKKIVILVLMVIILIVGLWITRFKTEDNLAQPEIDISNEETEVELLTSSQIAEYKQIFGDFLNKYYYNGENFENPLINDTMYSGILVEDNNDSIENNTNADQNEYVILDSTGTTIGFGTKEESDESFEKYGNRTVYIVRNCDQLGRQLNMKVYNDTLKEAELFIVELDDDYKMAYFYNVSARE